MARAENRHKDQLRRATEWLLRWRWGWAECAQPGWRISFGYHFSTKGWRATLQSPPPTEYTEKWFDTPAQLAEYILSYQPDVRRWHRG